tara:strand:- start:163 stop:510 length:348 start_codon:yes stop_codon:yes gene_type:complete
MVKIRCTTASARIYGKWFSQYVWEEATPQMVTKVKGANGWEIQDDEVVELPVVEEVVEETIEEIVEETIEVIDEVVDLSTLSKKELQKLCKEQGLEFKAFDNKSVLLSLLSEEEE